MIGRLARLARLEAMAERDIERGPEAFGLHGSLPFAERCDCHYCNRFRAGLPLVDPFAVGSVEERAARIERIIQLLRGQQ